MSTIDLAEPLRGRFQALRDDWNGDQVEHFFVFTYCLLYTSPSPRDLSTSRMPSSA